MNALIRLLYSLLVAGAVVAFAALASYSLYQPPKYPDYPAPSYSNTQSEAEYERQRVVEEGQRKVYDKKVDVYQEKERAYYHNVTVALLPFAAIAAIAGIYLMKRRSEVLGEGLALGSVAVTIYAVVTASLADARILRFVAASILLVIVLLVAHFRFSPAGKSTKHQLPL